MDRPEDPVLRGLFMYPDKTKMESLTQAVDAAEVRGRSLWTDARVRWGFMYEYAEKVTAYAELQAHWAFGDEASTEPSVMVPPIAGPMPRWVRWPESFARFSVNGMNRVYSESG